MRITIAERYRPFSHTPGTKCLIPGTIISAQVFPALIRFYDGNRCLLERPLDLQGPIKDFTVQLDLEKGYLRVFGQAANGFFRYLIAADAVENKIHFSLEKGKMLQEISLPEISPIVPPLANERLSLGSHKKQDWDLIRRREDLMEILPIWFALGQMTPQISSDSDCGVFSLLNSVDRADRREKPGHLLNLFNAGFEGMLHPRLEDSDFLGYNLSPVSGNESAVPIVTEGMRKIRKMFIEAGDESISILPSCPPEFHAGRMINLQTGAFGTLDIEWSKKQIRRMQFMAAQSGSLQFHFRKEIKNFRLRKDPKDRGTTLLTGTPLEIEKGVLYEFDRFQK